MNCTDGLTEAPAPGPLACSRPSTVIRHESRRRLGQEPKSTAEPARRGRARRGSRRHPSSPSSPSHRDSEIPAPGGEEEEEEEEGERTGRNWEAGDVFHHQVCSESLGAQSSTGVPSQHRLEDITSNKVLTLRLA
ncbi:unnamed protein product [Prorocentrum cordatum]|uniref:Uncharacterized protein n=1 Tax=Prorocentrum cordatum TaxID=2364126 RepID=A0ABN9UCU5_9DINO|nr:unnamed protein product [Polarella glacialis]